MASMWTFALVRLAGILIAGLVLGLLVGPIWLCFWRQPAFTWDGSCSTCTGSTAGCVLRSQITPPNIGGIWGDIVAQVVRLHRRKHYHKQQAGAALPGTAAFHRRASGRRHHPEHAERDRLVQNRQAARLLGLKRPMDVGLRVDNLIRSPEFVSYLHSDNFALPLVIRPPVQADLCLALQLVPYGAGQSLLLVRDVTRQMRLRRCARISSPMPPMNCARR